ncbi:CpsD/CapB family tyrosine-protein kinase [Thomasclavelia sp.]|uniref:polysaccharide biosynthesis tyrosine autokinase n=1 Tax=Thomasclavelia sp. TaxID=3025757 RepID=UPI00261A7A16|nr:CpsD/CapB family tyrosine-protein kinase [Thomasclavelia sp.]
MNKEMIKHEDEEIEIDLENIFINFFVGLRKFGIVFICLIVIYTGIRYVKAKIDFVPQYSCEATFAVSANGDDVTELVKTYSYLLTGNMMKEIVSEDLGVGTLPATITVDEVENTNFLLLKVISTNIDMAYNVVSSVLENYNSTLNLVVSNVELEVIVPPEKKDTPINQSDELKVAKMSLLQSGGVSLGILLLYALFRKTVQSPKDFKQCLHIEHLSSIPYFEFKRRNRKIDKSLLITNSKINQNFIDSYKLLRRRVENFNLKNGANTFLITSCVPQEGKTTTALNLAISLANKGKKTLLIDGDLRMCSVGEKLMITYQCELSKIISEERLDLSDLQKTSIENLTVVGNNQKISNSGEILSSKFLPDLIKFYQQYFDYVIVDSAPIGLLGDGKILARYCQGAIIVVRQDKVRNSLILNDITKLADEGIEIVGGVLNGVKRNLTNYGYYSYYYRYNKKYRGNK